MLPKEKQYLCSSAFFSGTGGQGCLPASGDSYPLRLPRSLPPLYLKMQKDRCLTRLVLQPSPLSSSLSPCFLTSALNRYPSIGNFSCAIVKSLSCLILNGYPPSSFSFSINMHFHTWIMLPELLTPLMIRPEISELCLPNGSWRLDFYWSLGFKKNKK